MTDKQKALEAFVVAMARRERHQNDGDSPYFAARDLLAAIEAEKKPEPESEKDICHVCGCGYGYHSQGCSACGCSECKPKPEPERSNRSPVARLKIYGPHPEHGDWCGTCNAIRDLERLAEFLRECGLPKQAHEIDGKG